MANDPSNKVADELARLRGQVNHHNHLYHTLDQPELSDAEFDLLFQRLQQLESQNPDLVDSNSEQGWRGPSQRSRNDSRGADVVP